MDVLVLERETNSENCFLNAMLDLFQHIICRFFSFFSYPALISALNQIPENKKSGTFFTLVTCDCDDLKLAEKNCNYDQYDLQTRQTQKKS